MICNARSTRGTRWSSRVVSVLCAHALSIDVKTLTHRKIIQAVKREKGTQNPARNTPMIISGGRSV